MSKLVKGLDAGTMNLVAAVQNDGGTLNLKSQRNLFIEVPNDSWTMDMLDSSKVSYVEYGEGTKSKLYVLGNNAFELARIFNRDPQRPMSNGVLSPEELNAVPILNLLIQKLLGKAQPGEECVFSVPADPIDSDIDIVFHKAMLEEVLQNNGYKPRAITEAHAVGLSELGDDNFTGIALSWGAGMVNISVIYRSIPAIVFSTSKSGDWIDKKVAGVTGLVKSRVTGIKERETDLMNPTTRVQKAIAAYYRDLVQYVMANIERRFKTGNDMPDFGEPIPIVCAGGTAAAKGFIELFREEYEKMDFPIPIKEIRMAKEPLYATAKGCLIAGLAKSGAKKQDPKPQPKPRKETE